MAERSKIQRMANGEMGRVSNCVECRVGATVDERMLLASAANRLLFEPSKPQRYNGPLVVVEYKDGSRVKECGLDSAEHLIANYHGASE